MRKKEQRLKIGPLPNFQCFRNSIYMVASKLSKSADEEDLREQLATAASNILVFNLMAIAF